MSSASSTTASLLRRRSRSIDYEMTFTDLSWVDDPFSPPTSNASAESQKTSRTSVSLFHNCKKTDTQPHFRGIDALFSRSDNLNRHTVARKTMNQPSSSIQFRKEVHSMQKIGNHDRPDLARTDTLHGIGAVPDTMEKAGHAESDWLFNRDFENLESEESPKSGKQKKLLRLQGLRKSGNSWPAEFLTTRPLDLKAENPPYKQSSLRMTELEEFLKAGNQLYKQRSLATTELGEFLNTDQHYTLDRQLKSHHIHLIALGSTIGTGIFLSPPVHGPLSLLMAFTLIGLIAWPFMYTLGELAAHFPMDIENSWIEDLNLYQKPPQFVILSGAAFSILQIMVSVAGVEFIPDGLLTCLFVISRIAFGVILYSATLKAISWTISRIRLLIQTCIESCTSSLPGRSSRSKSHAGQALIMSFLLWTTPVTAIATSLDTSTLSPCSSFLDVLYLDSGKLFSLFTTPQPPFPRSFPASTLLLALLLTTSLTIALYTLLRYNTSTKYLLCTSVCLALLLGSVSAVDIPDLVFRYLFLGVNFGLMISAFESVVKLVRFWRDRKLEMKVEVEKRDFVVGPKDMEAGGKPAWVEVEGQGMVGDLGSISDNGLHLIYDPPSNLIGTISPEKQCPIDIVAVHGLMGDAYNTWTH